MEESSESAMKVNDELGLNVDKLQEDKKCKKNLEIDDADEVQEITAARTPMKKKKHVCVTCNKRLALKMGVKNIKRKITLSSVDIIVVKRLAIKRK